MKESNLKYNNKGRVSFYIIRKLISFAVPLFILLFTLNSCQDMLETDNDSMVYNPELNMKTDSVFSALGIAQAMQQLADQYFYIGELRGELVTVDEAVSLNISLKEKVTTQAEEDGKESEKE